MITFIGEYSGKVDDKGRLVLPSPFKNLLSTDGDTRFVVKRNIFDGCLDMFTYAEWERQSNEIYSKLNIAFNRDHARFWREYMRDRAILSYVSIISLLPNLAAKLQLFFYICNSLKHFPRLNMHF